MPVVTPSRASIETVNAVPNGVVVLVGHHGGSPSSSQPLRRQAQADQAAAVRGHEVDGLGRHELGGDGEVALVLAVLVVDHDHELAARMSSIASGIPEKTRRSDPAVTMDVS